MRTIRVVLTLHAAVRYRARASSHLPVLRIHETLPSSATLFGGDLAVPAGRFRLKAQPLAGEYLAATFIAGQRQGSEPDAARGERVRVVWEAPRPN